MKFEKAKIQNMKIELKNNVAENQMIEGQVFFYAGGVFEGYTKLSKDYICGNIDKKNNSINFQVYTLKGIKDFVAFRDAESKKFIGKEYMEEHFESGCDIYLEAMNGCNKDIVRMQAEYLRYMLEQREEIETLKRKLS